VELLELGLGPKILVTTAKLLLLDSGKPNNEKSLPSSL
jgi:hypothetical protein